MGLTESAFGAQLEARGTHFRAQFVADCGSLQYCNRYCNRSGIPLYAMVPSEQLTCRNANNSVLRGTV